MVGEWLLGIQVPRCVSLLFWLSTEWGLAAFEVIDMTSVQRQQLAEILQSYDESGLIALANKGLVRRAGKDLEANAALQMEELDSALLVHGPDWVVTMPMSGPAAATDDTPATGITRQILAATIWLRDHWASTVLMPAGNKSQQVTAQQDGDNSMCAPHAINATWELCCQLTWADLERWAGKSLLKEASALLVAGLKVEIEWAPLLKVWFPEQEVEVRLPLQTELMAGRGRARFQKLLAACLSTAPKAFHVRWVLVALLEALRQSGQTLVPARRLTAVEATGAPRTRVELLGAVESFVESLLVTGLAHPSELMVQRLFTLSVSCMGGHLPRLARLLRRLASELQFAIERHAHSDIHSIFALAANVFGLTVALLRAGVDVPLALSGQHRSHYEPVGELQAVGCGAYSWQTQSGFAGVQLLLWDRVRQRFWSWSESRPVDTRGFDLSVVYRSSPVWVGAGSPEKLSRSQFRAEHVLANHLGRISNSRQTAVPLDETLRATAEMYSAATFGPQGFTDWIELAHYRRSTLAVGLQEPDPMRRVVVVFPTTWGERTFEELQQRLVWTVFDKFGQPLQLSVPWRDETEATIECLEALQVDRDRLTGVIGLLDAESLDTRLYPVAVISQGTPQGDILINLAFDRLRLQSRQESYLQRLREKYGRNRISTTLQVTDLEDCQMPVAVLPGGLEKMLSNMELFLLKLAESGGSLLNEQHQQQAAMLSQQAIRIGFSQLGPILKALANNERPQRQILLAKYICQLYRDLALVR